MPFYSEQILFTVENQSRKTKTESVEFLIEITLIVTGFALILLTKPEVEFFSNFQMNAAV